MGIRALGLAPHGYHLEPDKAKQGGGHRKPQDKRAYTPKAEQPKLPVSEVPLLRTDVRTHRGLLPWPRRNPDSLQSCRTTGRKGQETDAATNFPVVEVECLRNHRRSAQEQTFQKELFAHIIPQDVSTWPRCPGSGPCYSAYLHQVSHALQVTLYHLNPVLKSSLL